MKKEIALSKYSENKNTTETKLQLLSAFQNQLIVLIHSFKSLLSIYLICDRQCAGQWDTIGTDLVPIGMELTF